VWTIPASITGSELVFRNGQLLSPIVDYTVSGNAVTFLVPPLSTDNLVVVQ
jgi:hypothetical protein